VGARVWGVVGEGRSFPRGRTARSASQWGLSKRPRHRPLFRAHPVNAAAPRGPRQVSEERLRSMLEQISERDSKQSKITIQRRRPVFDEDD
jgi:hypothetical protein